MTETRRGRDTAAPTECNQEESRDSSAILVAEDSPEAVRKYRALLQTRSRRAFSVRWNRSRRVLEYYYPYYFQSWKATILKSWGRKVNVRLFTGVNGLDRSVGTAAYWPVVTEASVAKRRMIWPEVLPAEAEQLSREYVRMFINRRYRPNRVPTVIDEEMKSIYVRYFVFVADDEPLHKAILVEGFTGAQGRVKDVSLISKVLETDKRMVEAKERSRVI